MQHRRPGEHCLRGVVDGRELLVFDVDEPERRIRGVLVDGCNSRNGFTDETHHVRGDDGDVDHRAAIAGVRERVRGGHDRMDPGGLSCPSRVYAHDPGVPIRRAQRPAPQHAVELDVGGVGRPASRLVDAVDAGSRNADGVADGGLASHWRRSWANRSGTVGYMRGEDSKRGNDRMARRRLATPCASASRSEPANCDRCHSRTSGDSISTASVCGSRASRSKLRMGQSSDGSSDRRAPSAVRQSFSS